MKIKISDKHFWPMAMELSFVFLCGTFCGAQMNLWVCALVLCVPGLLYPFKHILITVECYRKKELKANKKKLDKYLEYSVSVLKNYYGKSAEIGSISGISFYYQLRDVYFRERFLSYSFCKEKTLYFSCRKQKCRKRYFMLNITNFNNFVPSISAKLCFL